MYDNDYAQTSGHWHKNFSDQRRRRSSETDTYFESGVVFESSSLMRNLRIIYDNACDLPIISSYYFFTG